MQAAYEAGKAEAEAICGADCNDLTRAVYGMAAVIRAAGRPVTWGDLARRWHYPLAGATGRETVEHWAGAMEGVLSSDYESREVGQLFRSDGSAEWRFHDLPAGPPSGDEIDKRAAALIDSEIKRKYPKVRRNTKRYRELADSVRDKARGVIRDEIRASMRRRVEDLRDWWKRDGQRPFYKAIADGEHLAALAADVLALKPDSERAAAKRDRAAEIMDRAAKRIERTENRIERAEAILNTLDTGDLEYATDTGRNPQAV